MNRIDRLQAILTILQSKRVVRAEDLAIRFEVSLRTIYRDIRSLETGGIPIGAEAGIGYFLLEGYHIPPVMFTHQEARALLLAGKIVAKMTDKEITANFDSALTKVRAVLDLEKKEELEGLERDIIINPFPHQKPNTGTEELQIDRIKSALSNSKVVSINYFSGGKGEHTDRIIEPLGICYYLNSWHLIAYCRLRNDYRDFRLDRITNLNIQAEKYTRFKHPSLQEYLDKLIQDFQLELCVIEIKKDCHRYLDSYKYQLGLVKEIDNEETVEMHFATFSLDYFARWVISMGTKITLKSPATLKEKVRENVLKINEVYLAE